MSDSELLRAHRTTMKILSTLRELRDVCTAIMNGAVPRGDPRLEKFAQLRRQLVELKDDADAVVAPQFPEFACVHEWPVTIHRFSASSGHQAALHFAGWVLGQSWRADRFAAWHERFYDCESKRMDWGAVRELDDPTDDGMREFWLSMDWAEHRALLEMEFAKASKLAANPSADIPMLADIETYILQALGNKTMTAEEISRAAGYPNNSNFRSRLPRMVERRLLEKVQPKGYRRGPLSRHCQV